ncbi:alpha/beta fold hydrolase [Fodinicola acaciae]|uniref:alpha/beta fold hydrolase n=1 Tax=Fodinicola acaciae TaxID=2681555 RepID=UPI0013D60BD2|nr:alpha/beta hydrolase [Fodinicola acaciae]
MATYVLVPGGWRGGWYFEPLARQLRRHGHEAYAVTPTGLGDRGHLGAATVNLDTHVQDVVALLESERIADAVLCGHSYGGMIVAGVADRVPHLIDAAVYCDAYVPADGQSCWQLTSDAFRRIFLENASQDGFSVAPPAGSDPRCTAHPLASFLQRPRLTSAGEQLRRRDFVYLSGWPETPFTAVYERLLRDPRWRVHSLPVGHDVMAAAADDLLDILLDVPTG